MEAFDAYKIYIALKTHFSSKTYDYKKYNGKTGASVNSFLKRKDRSFFGKVARKYKSESEDYFIANFLATHNGWVGEFNEENYIEYSKRMQSIKYNLKSDIGTLANVSETFEGLFECKDGQHPLLLKQYMARKISIETMSILENILSYCKDFDSNIKEDIIWPERRKVIKKYALLLTLDVNEYRMLTLANVKESF